jgi:hypothetical protein
MLPSLDERLPDRHLARLIIEAIARLGLRATSVPIAAPAVLDRDSSIVDMT